jgi:hypothetical protein
MAGTYQAWAVRPGGVIYYSDGVLPRPVVVRVEEAADGRLEIVELLLPRGEPVTSDQLRQVPVGRIDAWANRPGNREAVLSSLTEAHTTLAEEAAAEAASQANAVEQARKRNRAKSLRVPQPRGRRYPDSFYERIAELYLDLSESGGRPAAAIAEANGVPATTVHRWFREARDRGFLHAGRAGKAG